MDRRDEGLRKKMERLRKIRELMDDKQEDQIMPTGRPLNNTERQLLQMKRVDERR